MGYDLWEEGELKTLAKDSLLTKLVETLDIDIEKWVSSAVSVLPETLRVTTSRSDIEWTKQELRKMGGKPIPWMPNHFSHGIPGQAVAVMALHLYTFGTFIKPHHIAKVFLCIGTETAITRYSYALGTFPCAPMFRTC